MTQAGQTISDEPLGSPAELLQAPDVSIDTLDVSVARLRRDTQLT